MTPGPVHQWRAPSLSPGGFVSITERQADVLAGVCHGHSNEHIARRLGLAEDTVKTHLRHLFKAMGARNRAHAAALACSGQLTVLVRDDYARNPWKESA